ncbi:MAG: amidohydrolase [Actinobacteria bacterium]|nr:amidohydrolase [Actinomycetota bacterium]
MTFDDVGFAATPKRPPGGILIEGAAVVTVDDDFTIIDPGWVHVVADRIEAVGAGSAPDAVRQSVGRIIDGHGSAVMPGMTNSHTHLFQTFFRGLADDKPLLEWLETCIWPGAVHLDRESAQLAAAVGLIENLRSGATSVIDHQYVHIDEEIDDGVCSAADQIGIRFLLASGWADRNYNPALSESADTVIERSRRLRDRWHGHDNDRIRIELAPLIPWGCSDEAMRATVGEARSWGAGTHIHCAETSTEVDMNLDERGVRHIEWLEALGLLGPDFQLAHSVWLDDNELDLIAKHDAVVVHCPVSNMYLASGVARILDMRSRGITVALASDGPGSNNRQDMFETLKATVLLQKIHHLDAMALQPQDSLHMACRGGSRAFGTPTTTGSLEVGKKADLVVVDLESVFIAPVHRVPSALVFNATPADVSHVVVDGRILIDDGTVTMLDESALLAAAKTSATSVFTKAGVESRLTR